MTVQNAALFLLAMSICSLSLVAGYAVAYWREGSRSTRSRKSPPEPPPTGSFDARFARVEADQVALFSALEKITSELRRISSRQVRREEREERVTPAAPPPGTPKGDLRRYYGLQGMNPAQIAMKAQQGVQLELVNGGKEGS